MSVGCVSGADESGTRTDDNNDSATEVVDNDDDGGSGTDDWQTGTADSKSRTDSKTGTETEDLGVVARTGDCVAETGTDDSVARIGDCSRNWN